MKSSTVILGELLQKSGRRAGAEVHLPVYSVTKHRGFVPSLEYFNKQVFGRELSSYKIVEPGEFAYATIHLDEGSVGRAPAAGLVSPMYTVFSVDDSRVDAGYLLRVLKTPAALREYARMGNGSAERRRSISLATLGNMRVPVPSLPEQRRIVAILDQADELRTERRRAVELLDELADSAFEELHANYGAVASIRTLEELGTWKSGGTPSRAVPEYFSGPVPWATSGELNSMFIGATRESISKTAVKESSVKLVPQGALMLGMYDTAALKSAIASIPMACNQAIAFGVLDKNVALPEYVYFAVQAKREEVLLLQRGIRQKNLNLGIIKKISIQVPDIGVQRRFVAFIAQVNSLRLSYQIGVERLDELFSSLQDRAFRGEV